MELYFFRDVSTYDELMRKTDNAYSINSINKRKVNVVKRIVLKEKEAADCFEKLKKDNRYVIENLALMKIQNGIWNCLELVANDKSIIVMADGYPYAKFVALPFRN